MSKRTEMPSTAGQIFHGRCHCGAITLSVIGPLRQILACHCDDCRRLAGALGAATAAPRDSYRFTRDASLELISQFDLGAAGVLQSVRLQPVSSIGW